MIEKLLQVRTGDGEMETFIAHPEPSDSEGPSPVIVIYMDAPAMEVGLN